jgi:hypothetical protein
LTPQAVQFLETSVVAGLVTDIDKVITTYHPVDTFRDLVLPAIAHRSPSEVAQRVKALGSQASHQAIVQAVQGSRRRRRRTPRSALRRAVIDVELLEAASRNPLYRDRLLALLQHHLEAGLLSTAVRSRELDVQGRD